jgi:hypothetical protein
VLVFFINTLTSHECIKFLFFFISLPDGTKFFSSSSRSLSSVDSLNLSSDLIKQEPDVSTHEDFEDYSGLLIVGDIHGNLESLLHVLEIVDKMMTLPSSRAKVLF